MRTSVTCLSSNQRAFTLLEMLVVLLLIGLITAVAMPGLQRMNASLERSLKRDQLETTVNALPVFVRGTGRSLVLKGDWSLAADLPLNFSRKLAELDVKLITEGALFMSASGFCPFGAKLVVVINGHRYPGELESPSCRLIW